MCGPLLSSAKSRPCFFPLHPAKCQERANGKKMSNLLTISGLTKNAGHHSLALLLAIQMGKAAPLPAPTNQPYSNAGWTSLNSAMPEAVTSVNAATVDSRGNLYIGGTFTSIGGVAAYNIAKWDGISWSALDTGIRNDGSGSSTISALAASGTDVYAGGIFKRAGGITANNIAKWDGSSWSALSSGTDYSVRSLLVRDGALIVGGNFTRAGDTAANFIAKWDGGNWSTLGSGMSSTVRALVSQGTDLYAGGDFAFAGGVWVNNVAKWDGAAWSPLGTGHIGGHGFNGSVHAMAVMDSVLFVGGSFTSSSSGGIPFGHLARWAGRSWEPLGSVEGFVNALAVDGKDLYVGGSFKTAGGVLANNIAKWYQSETSSLGSWSALGSGTHDRVSVLTFGANRQLFVGGSFLVAGGVSSPLVAHFDPTKPHGIAPSIVVIQPASVVVGNGGTRTFSMRPQGISITKTFTILNRGDGAITGLALALDGPDAAHFSIAESPRPTVAAGKRTSFKIRFKPSTALKKSALLRITNAIPGEDPYVIYLEGERALTNRR
jgi:hypothetical protein